MKRLVMKIPALAAATLLLCAATGCSQKNNEPVVTVSRTNPLDGPFLGFGAQWDSTSYRDYGIDDASFSLISERMDWMRIPLVRVMMLSSWCYKGDGRYDFDSPAMQMLYRQLDYCEKAGVEVVLTDWGLNDSWMKTPGLEDDTDPKYAEVIAEYMNHLLNVKKYTCIKQFVYINEPEWMRYNKLIKKMTPTEARETWHQGLRNVRAALGRRGLLDRVRIAGPDQSGNEYDWAVYMAKNAPGDLDSYDLHLYANQRRQFSTVRETADKGAVRDYLRQAWTEIRQNDPDKSKPLILGEAGFALWHPEVAKDEQFGRKNGLALDWRYGLFMTQYAIQAVEAGTWGISAWMLDDNSHYNFTWGLWGNKSEGFPLKPWFYTWGLLSRYFPANSTFSLLDGLPPNVEGIAAELPPAGKKAQGWSFVFVNTGETPVSLRVDFPQNSAPLSNRYLFAEGIAPKDEKGFPIPQGTLKSTPGAKTSLELPPRSVTFLTPAGFPEAN